MHTCTRLHSDWKPGGWWDYQINDVISSSTNPAHSCQKLSLVAPAWFHKQNQTQIGAFTSLHLFHVHIISSGPCPGAIQQCLCVFTLLYTIIIRGCNSVMKVKQWSVSAKLATQFRMGLGSACLSTSPDQSSMETVELKAEEEKFLSPFVGLQEKK